MESPLMMLLHGAVIAVVLYLVLRYGFGNSNMVAQSRAILVGLLLAAYMIVFGHKLPTQINKKLL
jgi:high-affinity Fe2+/Pb2+ permease